MKKIKLIMPIIASSLACTSVASMVTLASCNGQKEDPETTPTIEANTNSLVDYVYKTQDSKYKNAQFILNIKDFDQGDKVTLSITSAKSYTTGKAVDYAKLVNNEFTIAKDQTQITFDIKLSNDSKYDTPDELELSIKVSFTHAGKTTTRELGNKFWAEIGIPTQTTDFVMDGTKVTGFNSDQISHINQCNLLLLPADATEIADNAFWDEDGSASKIPETMNFILLDSSWGFGTPTLQKIGDNAFRSANFYGVCYIPSSVQTIGKSAFSNCKFNKFQVGTSATENSNSLTKIDSYAFSSCNFSGDCKLPEGLELVGDYAFYKCPFTGDYYLPSTIQKTSFDSHGGNAFSENYKCKGKLIIAEGTNSYLGFGSKIFHNTTIAGPVVVPDCFSGHNIGDNVFSGTNIESISLPKGLENIFEQAFANCPNLQKLDFTRIDTADDIVIKGGSAFKKSVYSGLGANVEKITVYLNKKLQQDPGFNETEFKSLLSSKGMDIDKVEIQYKEN